MRQSERRKCISVDVMRGAECHTDQQLLQMKLLVGSVNNTGNHQLEMHHRGLMCPGSKVLLLMTRGRLQPRESFKTGLHRARLKSKRKNEGSAEEKWNLLKSTLCEAAESTLGKQTRRNPDWFVESAPKLKPLLDKRNRLYLYKVL